MLFRSRNSGRAGSGKSSVARALASRGAQVIDADRIGHEITDTDPEVRRTLLAEYGPAVYLDDGKLNRRLVATMVFSSPPALEALNGLVHPRILLRTRQAITQLVKEGFRGPVIVDAALLLDWAFERECDAVIAVTAPEEAQLSRLLASRGWTADEARRRLAAQRPNAVFATAADVAIENAGTEAELAESAVRALEQVSAVRGVGRT